MDKSVDLGFVEKRREQKHQDYLKNRDAYIARATKSYQRNKPKAIERSTEWNKTHNERRKEICAKSRENNRGKTRKKAAEMRFTNREQYNKYFREMYLKRKLKVFRHYSPDLTCQCCKDDKWEFLTIDHINGKKAHNHDRKMVGRKLYTWLINNNYPPGFRVLCMNCNFAEGMWGYCPHNKEVVNTHE